MNRESFFRGVRVSSANGSGRCRWGTMATLRRPTPATATKVCHFVALLLFLMAGCQQPESAPSPARAESELPQPMANPAATMLEKAGVGSGEKGRGYGAGPIATPAAAYFAAQERVAFDIEIPHALELYKATEGHAPTTHAEFMRSIIEANRIRLPTLPPGHRYLYDPKSERLMVERPAE